jgi:hypothetical protein
MHEYVKLKSQLCSNIVSVLLDFEKTKTSIFFQKKEGKSDMNEARENYQQTKKNANKTKGQNHPIISDRC